MARAARASWAHESAGRAASGMRKSAASRLGVGVDTTYILCNMQMLFTPAAVLRVSYSTGEPVSSELIA